MFKNNELTPDKIILCDAAHFQNSYICESLHPVRVTAWPAVPCKETFIEFAIANVPGEVYCNILTKKNQLVLLRVFTKAVRENIFRTIENQVLKFSFIIYKIEI